MSLLEKIIAFFAQTLLTLALAAAVAHRLGYDVISLGQGKVVLRQEPEKEIQDDGKTPIPIQENPLQVPTSAESSTSTSAST